MKIRKSIFAAIAMCLFSANASRASLITFSDVFDPLDVFFTGQSGVACTGSDGALDTTSASTCESLTWTQALPGFQASDILTSGTLTLTAYDDTSTNGQTFNLLVDLLTLGGTVTDFSTLGSPNTFHFTVLSQLADGAVDVTLTSHNGNHTFFFGESELDAAADRLTDSGGPYGTGPAIDPPVAPVVPEPGTLTLVGFGLLSTSSAVRRWIKKR